MIEKLSEEDRRKVVRDQGVEGMIEKFLEEDKESSQGLAVRS